MKIRLLDSKKYMCILLYEMIKLGEGIFYEDMIVIFLFERFLRGSEIRFVFYRLKFFL